MRKPTTCLIPNLKQEKESLFISLSKLKSNNDGKEVSMPLKDKFTFKPTMLVTNDDRYGTWSEKA